MRSAWNFPLNDAVNLVQLLHQVGLILQTSCRIAQQDVCPALLGGLNRVEHDRRRIGTGLLLDHVNLGPFAPDLQLLDRACAERVPSGQNDLLALLLIIMGQLADRCRFANAVDADEQNDADPVRIQMHFAVFIPA
ncbi:hypothetical protein D3C74_282490 [compost metagenome]